LEEKSKEFNLFQVARAVLIFVLLCYIAFFNKSGIESFYTSNFIVNIICLIYLLLRGFIKKYKLQKVYKNMLIEIVRFGIAGMVFNALIMLLLFCDRYIVQYYCGYDKTGIYHQIYQIGNLSMVALVSIFWGAINPFYNRQLEANHNNIAETKNNLIYLYLILILPLCIYASLFAREISQLMLGKQFQEGSPMIPYIMFSAFLYGVILIFENSLMFKKQYKQMILFSLLALLFNVVLNIVFIPLTGYMFAALSTLIAYIFLFLLFYKYDKHLIKLTTKQVFIIKRMSLILLGQLAIHFIIVHYIKEGVYFIVIEGFFYLILYFVFSIKPVYSDPFLKKTEGFKN
jgi:O-antigen/teichoic acid export membrane protein